MNPKQWVKRLLIITLIFTGIPAGALAGFNYWIDPLWNFSLSHEYNDYQVGFDERQQKTNYVRNSDFDYDGLLIGTSRVTYMNEHSFEKEKVYNYSLSALHIDEYLPYIKYATEKNGRDFKTVYLELYYHSYNKNAKRTGLDPSVYFEKAEDPFYKYISLFSYSTLKLSMDNFKISRENYFKGPKSYNRENVVTTSVTNERIGPKVERFASQFKSSQLNAGLPYNEEYKERLIELKTAFPETRFVVFTDPMPAERLNVMLLNENHRKAYERWYYDMVDVFGEVYSFQGNTPLTTNLDNWFDVYHYYPESGDLMIKALENPEQHKDIVHSVNKSNVDNYLNSVISDALKK